MTRRRHFVSCKIGVIIFVSIGRGLSESPEYEERFQVEDSVSKDILLGELLMSHLTIESYWGPYSDEFYRDIIGYQ